MRKGSLLLGLFIFFNVLFVPSARAQTPVQQPSQTIKPVSTASPNQARTIDELATPTASSSTTSAATAAPVPVQERIQEQKDGDITEAQGKQRSKLETFLDEHPAEALSWNNPLELSVRSAIKRGVPANILVLVILFPLIASLIAASRHIIGLRGFGIYIPAVLSVALISTGVLVGLIIFLAIVGVALGAKKLLRRLSISYLPRTAMLLWLISLAILFVILIAPYFNLTQLMSVNIFPILILVLLSENFLDAQASTKPSEAFKLAMETIGLAFVSGFILRWEYMQHLALLEPELVIVGTAIFNMLVGKFVGLRVSEWLRFRPIIEE